ncbi:MAG: STAS domain-containing protein [Pseudomonadales bacterium]
MSIDSVMAAENGQQVVTIRVSEYFDYQCIHEFRQAFTERAANEADYVVDLSLTKYIDSCALGMLLSLDKMVRRQCRNMRVVNCSDHVRKIFSVLNFDRKLSISSGA